MSSYLDKSYYPFDCQNPRCRGVFRKVLRTLIDSKEVHCRYCGTVHDITESKRTGDIQKALAKATSLDKASSSQASFIEVAS